MGEFVQEHARRSRRQRSSAARPRATRRGPRVARRRAPAVPARRRVVEPPRDRATTTAATTRWPSPTRSGRRSSAGWARAAPITSCARASRRCSCRGSRRGGPRRAQGADRRAADHATARTTPRTTRRTPTTASPALRDSNPSVVVIPGLGLFGFGKDKREARITSEFFVNAIHVMAGANALEDTERASRAPAAAGAAAGAGGRVQELPATTSRCRGCEAFRIEYWALEEAKLQRMPPEREFSRKIAVVVGGASGIGREVALQLAKRGAHVVVADLERGQRRSGGQGGGGALVARRWSWRVALDLTSRDSIAAAFRATVLQFGGIDIVINTAAIYPTPAPGTPPERRLGADAAASTSRATTCSPGGREGPEGAGAAGVDRAHQLGQRRRAEGRQRGVRRQQGGDQSPDSRAGDRPRAARPRQRHRAGDGHRGLVDVPARPRDGVAEEVRHRVHRGRESTEALRSKLAEFYARRTITRRPILPVDCANAICFLAGDQSAKTTGHVIPVDGGLPEAFLR